MDDPWADAPASPLPKSEHRFGNVNINDNENANAFSNYSLPKSPSANEPEKVQEEQTEEKTKVETETEPSREEINGALESDDEAQVAQVQSSPAQESHQWLSPQVEASDQEEKAEREESEEREEDGEDEQDDFDDFSSFDGPRSSSFSTPNPDKGGMPGEGGDIDDGFGDFADFEKGEFDEPVGAETGIGGNGLVEEPEPIKERWVCPPVIF